MKKKLVSALALMMSCVMLAACGGNKVEENTTTPQTETSEAVTESTEEAASTETEAAGELTDVNVAALKGPTAMGMVKLMDDSDNGDTGANHYNFTIAASPDEITPQTVSIIAAFPIAFIILLIVAAFFKDAKKYLSSCHGIERID